MTPDQVVSVFRALLERDPESETAIEDHVALGGLEQVIGEVSNSVEYLARTRPGPLWNYAASFDPVETVYAHENHERQPIAGHRVNYLGVAVNVDRFFPTLELENSVEDAPVPANWHTDVAELAAALRAVENAGDDFSMVELGCGWGCWMNITAAAARRAGKKPFVIGVEGDEGHVAFAHEALATNGVPTTSYHIFRGVAAGRAGRAFFPRQEQSGGDWGLEPVLGPPEEQAATLRESGRYDELPMIPLSEIIGDRPRLDLLHIDIQGGETALIRESLELLDAKVAYIVVGTHSRVIDGEIIALLERNGGWALEIERPCIHELEDGAPITVVDGVQGWRNKRF